MSAEEKIEMSGEDEKARISEPKQEVQCIVSSFYKYYIPYFFQLARLSNDGAPSIQR